MIFIKRYLAIAIGCMLIVGCVGCSNSKNTQNNTKNNTQTESSEDAQKTAPQAETAAPQAETKAPQTNEQSATDKNIDKVLWEEKGIKITYKGAEESLMGTGLKLLVENNSSTDFIVSLESIDVNGYTLNSMISFYAEVSAGKKANDEINLYTSELEKNGISSFSDIKTIELKFEARNSKNYMETVTSPVISLNF